MFLLHKAGLLRNKPVTTYWRALSELRSFKDIDVEEERVVKSGNIWTSGGVSSGIDLAFELIVEIAGKEEAGRVQLLFEYFPKADNLLRFGDLQIPPALLRHQGASPVEVYCRHYQEGNDEKGYWELIRLCLSFGGQVVVLTSYPILCVLGCPLW